MSEERKFEPEELILVDTHELGGCERWEPAIYIEQLFGEQRHLVEVMENGRKVTHAYHIGRLRHAKEAYELEVKYEVYADNWRGSDVLSYDGVNGEAGALENAKSWSLETDNDVIVDRVVFGGDRKYAVYSKGEKK